MPPLSLWFQRNPATEAVVGLQRGGKLVMAANHAVKVMRSSDSDLIDMEPGADPDFYAGD